MVFMRGEERLSGEQPGDGPRHGQGHVRERAAATSAPGRVRGGAEDRARGRRHLPHRGREVHVLRAAQPALELLAPPRRTLEVDDKIVGHNVVFRVKAGARVLHRRTSSTRSSRTSAPPASCSRTSATRRLPRLQHRATGFFWAMGRSFDQTFYVDNYSKFGYGFGHEFRYALAAPSRGQLPHLRSSAARTGGAWEHDLDWNAQQMLPGKRAGHPAACRSTATSPSRSRSRTASTWPRSRTRRTSLNLQRSFGTINVQLLADSTDTFFPTRTSTGRTQRHLPTLRLNQSAAEDRAHRRWCSATRRRGERLGIGDQDRVDQLRPLRRLPARSRARCPCRSSRSRRRCRSATPATATDGRRATGIDRPARSTAATWRPAWTCAGPPSRACSTRRGTSTPTRYKHVIGPEVTWTYRSRVDEFDVIPKFDRHRLLPGHERGALLAGAAPLRQAAGPRRQAGALRVLHLARLADLLRADRGQPERVRPQLLLVRLRPRRRPRAPARRCSRGCASGPPRPLRATSTWSTT